MDKLYIKLHNKGVVSEWIEVPEEGVPQIGLTPESATITIDTLKALESRGAYSMRFEFEAGDDVFLEYTINPEMVDEAQVNTM